MRANCVKLIWKAERRLGHKRTCIEAGNKKNYGTLILHILKNRKPSTVWYIYSMSC